MAGEAAGPAPGGDGALEPVARLAARPEDGAANEDAIVGTITGGASPGGGAMGKEPSAVERVATDACADTARKESQTGQSLPSHGAIAGGTRSIMVS